MGFFSLPSILAATQVSEHTASFFHVNNFFDVCPYFSRDCFRNETCIARSCVVND